MFQRIWSEFSREANLRSLTWILLVVLAIRQWVWTPVVVTGRSMLPTWSNGQLAGINKLAYLVHSPQRGDVVFVWTGSELLIKRIVGLPGEEVYAREGAFYVNGEPIPEPYVQFHGCWRIAPGKLGDGRFLVAGDNRSQTLISVVRRGRIVGRVSPFL
jgi:signal peptidase I